MLNSDALPFYEACNAKVSTMLRDNGREFCCRKDQHPYELFLRLEEIEHHTNKVRRPQSNGFIERLHRTLLDEHFRIQGHSKWYEALEKMQQGLDVNVSEGCPHPLYGLIALTLTWTTIWSPTTRNGHIRAAT